MSSAIIDTKRWNENPSKSAPNAIKSKTDSWNKNKKNRGQDRRVILTRNNNSSTRLFWTRKSRNYIKNNSKNRKTDTSTWTSFVHKNCHRSLPLLIILGCNLMTYGTDNFSLVQQYDNNDRNNESNNSNIDHKTALRHRQNQANGELSNDKAMYGRTSNEFVYSDQHHLQEHDSSYKPQTSNKALSHQQFPLSVNELKSLGKFINNIMEISDIFPIKPVQATDRFFKRESSCTGCDKMDIATLLKKPATTRDLTLKRLKRGFRSRPKLTTRIFNKVSPILKKVSPTKVLIGSHLGTLAYRKYTNYTNSLNNNNSTGSKNQTTPSINANVTAIVLNDTLSSSVMPVVGLNGTVTG